MCKLNEKDLEEIRNSRDIAEMKITYLNVIKKWNNKALFFVIEEMSELTKQLTKFLEGRGNISKITKEMTDVEIQLDILKILFDNLQDIKDIKPLRIRRIQIALNSNEDKKMLDSAIEPGDVKAR